MLKEKISSNEILISVLIRSFFLGSVPVIILEHTQTNLDVVDVLTTLNPGDHIIIYLFSLFMFQVAVWFVNIRWLKPNENNVNPLRNSFC